MRLPYFIGCPSWSENAWREYLYPADARSSDYLGLYSQVFNAVEGNTTFYARPSTATVQRWAEIASPVWARVSRRCRLPCGKLTAQ